MSSEEDIQKVNEVSLLGPISIRRIAAQLGVQPTKKLGQNFLHDAGTVRRIVATAEVNPGEIVIEVGPGLGSLTLGLLEAGASVCAIEIDPLLAGALPSTVARYQPLAADRFRVVNADALSVDSWSQCAPAWSGPTRLIANLPYNVAVPILLHFLASFPTLRSTLVMVQSEVADRLAALPGNRVYGVPSVKAAWYGKVSRSISIGRNVFWPVPNVDSALVNIQLFAVAQGSEELRKITFKIVDVAFAQRRKMLRAALRSWVDDSTQVALLLDTAGIDPTRRGETLTVGEYKRLGQAALAISAKQAPALAHAVAVSQTEGRYA